jgi:hypothetical protein
LQSIKRGCFIISIYLSIYGSIALVNFGRFFSFLIYAQLVGLLGREMSLPQGRYLHTEQHKHRINAHTSMPRVRFEPKIPVFERAMTVHALGRAAPVMGTFHYFIGVIYQQLLYIGTGQLFI